MQETTNKKLKKIDLTDRPPDITVINHNWDKIDTELQAGTDHSNNNAIHVTASDKTNWNNKVNKSGDTMTDRLIVATTGFRGPTSQRTVNSTVCQAEMAVGATPSAAMVLRKAGTEINRMDLKETETTFSKAVAIGGGGTGATTAAAARANLGAISTPTVLYNSTNGTTGNFTLSQSVANFKWLRLYVRSDSLYSSVDTYTPQNKTVSVAVPIINDTALFLRVIVVYFSGTNATVIQNRDWWCTWAHSVGGASNRTYVMRVEAWN